MTSVNLLSSENASANNAAKDCTGHYQTLSSKEDTNSE